MFDNTVHSLMRWYVAEVEKFGWMIVFSQNEPNGPHKENKLNLYRESLNELRLSFEARIEKGDLPDYIKNDLMVTHKKLVKFISAVNMIMFPNNMTGGAKKSKKPSKKSSKKTSKKSKKQMEW
jgi:hypothetical protein